MKNVNTTSVVFYLSYVLGPKEAGLSKEDRCDFYEGLMSYATTEEIPVFTNPVLRGFFTICKENIDATLRKNRRRTSSIANGKKGGAPKGNKNAAKSTAKSATKATAQPASQPQENTQENTVNNNVETTQETTQNSTYSNNTITSTDTITNTKTLNKTFSLLKEKRKERKGRILEHRTINERNEKFYNSLQPYVVQYGPEAIQDFYEFWCEPDTDLQYMKFELERTWDLEYRIEQWMRKRKVLKHDQLRPNYATIPTCNY